MPITYKKFCPENLPPERCYPDPQSFCCDKLAQKWQERDSNNKRRIRVSDYIAYPKYPHRIFIPGLGWIEYCPFCGEKIHFEEINQ